MSIKRGVIVTAVLLSIGCTTVEPGHVGIKVNMFGGNRGVDDYPVVTGRVLYNPISTNIFEYPTYVQTGNWTYNEDSKKNEEMVFNSKEGLVVRTDVGLSFQLKEDKVPHFYVKYRSDDIEDWLHGYLRNIARDAFNEVGIQYTTEELYGDRKEEFMQSVRQRISNEIQEYATLEQLGIIGALRLPSQVTESLNAKIQAIQDSIRAENQLRSAEAEARKAVATAQGQSLSRIALAEGEAKANELLSNSLTPKLLEWRRLEVLQNKWDGQYPRIMSGNTGIPMIMSVDPETLKN